MGRRKRRSKGRSGKLGAPDTIGFRWGTSAAFASGAATIAVQPSTFGPLANIATNFELYKFTRLKYRIHPNAGTSGSVQAMAYIPDSTVVSGTLSQVMSLETAVMHPVAATVPSSWRVVDASTLRGLCPWYKCTADASSTEFEQQGTIILIGSGTDTYVVEFSGVCSFKDRSNASINLKKFVSDQKSPSPSEVLSDSLNRQPGLIPPGYEMRLVAVSSDRK